MKNSKLKIQNCRFLFCVLHFAFCISLVAAQSTNQNYPTAVTTNEISGAIKARDLGDARLTAYFYIFNAGQGDVFINVVANNFNGNIDVFTVDGLKPLTKIVVFADASSNETGRVVYLRKPEKLLLRVEGRTPNDEAAIYRIKFAGSFQALNEAENTDAPAEPKVASANDSDVRVNSVGTIIAVNPRPTPQPKETVAETDKTETKNSENKEIKSQESNKTDSKTVVSQISIETSTEKSVIADTNAENKNERNIEVTESKNKLEVVVTENAAPREEKRVEIAETENPAESKINATETTKPVKSRRTTRANRSSNAATPPNSAPKKTKAEIAAELNGALENIRLIVLMKDGSKIERPMSEVLRVGVDKGVLTIIAKDGAISRYSILDVAKMTIE